MVTQMRPETGFYIAIMKMGQTYSIFNAASGEYFGRWKELAKNRGVDVVAEIFGISDEEINILTGFTRDGKPGRKNLLSELKERLDSGKIEDYQKALDYLVDSTKNQNT